MEDAATNFIYHNGLLLEPALLLYLLFFVASPQHLIAVIAALFLIRPNERFDCLLPYPKVSLAILLMVILSNAGRLPHIFKRKESRPLLWLCALVMLETLLFHREYLVANAVTVGSGLLFFLAILLFMEDGKGFSILAWVTAFSSLIICLEPLYYHYNAEPGGRLWHMFHSAGRLQAWGMWSNANETAFIACLGAANSVILLLRLRCRKFRHILLSILALAVFAWTVFLTGSRSGLVALFLLFLPCALYWRSAAAKVLILVACLGALAASYSLRPERSDAEASTMERSDLRYEGRQMFFRHPAFGVGYGKAPDHSGGQLLHNTYLQAFAETGVIGGVLLLSYLASLAGSLCRAMQRERGTPDGPTLLLLAGLYLSSVFYLYWGNQLLSVLFFLINGEISCYLSSLAANPEKAPADAAWQPSPGR